MGVNLIILGHFRVIELIPGNWYDSNMIYLFLNIQQQLAFQLELEMQEKERQKIEELQRAQELLESVI